MLNVSNQFKKELLNDNRRYLCYVDIALADGTILHLENPELWNGGVTIEDSVSDSGNFAIGAAIINKLTLTINNIYDTYSVYDFTDAEVTCYVGIELPDGIVEKVPKGCYIVDETSYDGSFITISALDYMSRLDRSYQESQLAYPAALSEIVRDACSICGMSLLTGTFNNSSYCVQERPEDDSLTFRQVISWAAQLACCYARCNVYGQLCFDWYDQSVFESYESLNGGEFDGNMSYITGDRAAGGSFKPWTAGDVYTGGTFKELEGYHHIYSVNALELCTDEVVITGLRVKESFEETEGKTAQEYLYGEEGYVISIEGNDLIQHGTARMAAEMIGKKVVGMKFRPFSATVLSDPTMEAGDAVFVTDRKQRSYPSYITSTTFKTENYQQIQCDAKTPGRNSTQRSTEVSRSVVLARREAAKKISEYDKSVQLLTNMITQSFGIFKTEEVQEDGAVIYHLHNKPTLEESKIIWKMTTDAFAVSTDGGKSWNAGMDSNGNAVVNVLSAIGIHFDWASGGTLTLGGQNDTNGKQRILSASGEEIGSWSKDGLIASKGIFGGDLIIKNVENSKYPVNIQGKDGTKCGIGPTGFLYARNNRFVMLDYDSDADGPRFSGGTYTSITDALVMSGVEPRTKLDFDGMIKSEWIYENRGAVDSNLHINSSGYITRTGSSSKRYKEDISETLGELDPEILYDMPVKTFKYKEGYLMEEDEMNGKTQIGFIVEDFLEHYPLAVQYENGEPEMWNSKILIPAMLKLIQRQHEEIEELKKVVKK